MRARMDRWTFSAAVAAMCALAVVAAAAPPRIAEACSFKVDPHGAQATPIATATTGVDGAAAIEAMRQDGPASVDALLAAAPPEHDPTYAAWERALDAVCAQRDCAASGLYWYTDLDRAIAAAEESGRPILSLRLLGRLDQERSCANSRFFRTVLYADPEVSARLREDFVLHWQSVRPVPRLTVDFGDGRRLEGTITGNSVHLVLDSKGRPIDALPGLYGAGLFLDRLEDAGATARELAPISGKDYFDALSGYHRDRLARLDADLVGFGGLNAIAPRLSLAEPPPGADPPDALQAELLTASKSFGEMPVVRALWRASWRPVLAGGTEPGAVPFDWDLLAAARRSDWRLSDASRAMLLVKHRPAEPSRGERVIAEFERLVGLDTVRNEYLLHAVVHRWLEDEPGLALEELTERLYDQLFLTPGDDPWLGLVSPDTYLALERSLVEPVEPVDAAAPPASATILSSVETILRAEGVER